MGAFVGDERRRVVDELVQVVDALDGPRLVVLTASIGTGKTRIVQELYRRLAERQAQPGYWPPAIVEDDMAGADPGNVRKRVSPARVSEVSDAHMPFLWWGITCHEVHGELKDTLLGDGEVLAHHVTSMYERWRGIRRFKKLVRDPETKGRALAFVGLVGAVAGPLGLLGGAVGTVYGLGMEALGRKGQANDVRDLVDAARRRIESMRDQARADAEGRQVELRRGERPEEVDLLATSLTEVVAGEGRMPTVVVLDDAHWADPNVVRLARRVLAHPTAPILLLATAWPEELGAQRATLDETCLAHVMAASHDRTTEIALDRLDDVALAEIVREVAPRTAEEIVAALCRHADGSPLALRLVLARRQVAAAIVDGRIELTEVDVASLPSDVAALYRDLWDELDPDVRTTLQAAALLDGDVVAPLAIAAATAMGVDAAAARLAEAESPYRWVRRIEELVLGFTEAVRRELAAEEPIFEGPLARARAALVAEAARLARDRTLPPVARERVLRAIETLTQEGFNEDLELARTAAADLAELLAARYADSEELSARRAEVHWLRSLPAADGRLVAALLHLAINARQVGERETVDEATAEALVLARERAEQAPDDPAVLSELASALHRRGELERHDGDLLAASTSLVESVEVHLRAERAGAPRQNGVDTSRVMGLVSDVTRERGELALATEAAEEALSHAEGLPDGLDAPVVAEHLGRLALLADVAGREEEAVALAERALLIRRELISVAPEGAAVRRDLSVGLEVVGLLALRTDRLAVAEERLTECLGLRRELVALQPDNVETLWDLSDTVGYLGNVAEARGDVAAAARWYLECLEIRREVAARQPDSWEAARDLGVSISEVSRIGLAAGDRERAHRGLAEVVQLSREQVARRPASVDALRDLLCALADLASALEDPDAIERALDEAIAIGGHLVDRQAESAEALGDLRFVLELRSHLLGDPGGRSASDEGDGDPTGAGGGG